VIPDGVAAVAGDVYKAGRHAGSLWRQGEQVTFAYLDGYDGPPVAFTLPLGTRAVEDRFRLPPFFAGLLPEGETRRRALVRALHVAEEDELGLLVQIGADTIGDVQVLPTGAEPPSDEPGTPVDLSTLTFGDLWDPPESLHDRSSVAGVQPKMSSRSRSLIGGRAGRVILKFSPDPSWHGVLENEALFMAAARGSGSWHRMCAWSATATVCARWRSPGSTARSSPAARAPRPGGRHAGAGTAAGAEVRPRRPGGHRRAVRGLCRPARRRSDLVHQLLYSYVVGNNDVHAKNLSVGQDPRTGYWSVTPVYDVLHTWPYESDHTFHPALGGAAHDTVTRSRWEALAPTSGSPGVSSTS
jgi:serine/threonine-protein kinase HipA